MNSKKPSVAVVVATYNGAKYLRPQLDSILSQTYPVNEIIIQDDGSTDGTLDILRQYVEKDNRVHLFKNEGKHGINNNFYSAIRKSSSDFIAISDQDDIWLPDKIEKEIEAFKSGKGVLCGGRSVHFSEDGAFSVYDSRRPNLGLFRLINCAEVPGHTMLFRLDWFKQLPWASPALNKRLYDIILSIAAAASEELLWVDTPLVRKRNHFSSATYTDMSTSIPSWKNAFGMVHWCLLNYKAVKRASRERYQDIITFIRDLGVADRPNCQTAIRMLELQQSTNILDMLHLQLMCIKHRTEILHTNEKSFKNFIHAALFPITSCWYNRFLLQSHQQK